MLQYNKFFYFMYKICLFGLIIGLAFTACNPPKTERSNALREEIESREIKKIPEGEVIASAAKWGESLAKQTQQLLGSNLKKALKEAGPKGAIEFCNIQAYPLVDSVQQNRDIVIRRTSLKTRNQENNPSAIEKRILEAYHYNQESDQPLTDNVQQLENNYLLYTKPIIINNSLCLNCHGKVGKNVTEETYTLIKELYPGDSATGFELGDLRGMWSIKMASKEIVKQL